NARISWLSPVCVAGRGTRRRWLDDETLAVPRAQRLERRFPRVREIFPAARDQEPLPAVSGVGHRRLIASNVLTRLARRHSAAWAVASLVIAFAGTTGAIVLLMTVGDVSPDVRSGL